MDRDEFERIKSAEKERLRTRKRLQQTLETLKRRRRVHDAVSAMTRRASDLLEETDALVRTLASDAATSEARLDLALDSVESVESIDLPDEPSDPKLQPSDSTRAGDEAGDEDDVESRAEQVVQQMKMASGPQHRRSAEARRTTTSQRPSHPTETRRHQRTGPADGRLSDASDDQADERAGDRVGDEPGDEPADERPGDTTTTTLPEKTIGRMTDSGDDTDEATS